MRLHLRAVSVIRTPHLFVQLTGEQMCGDEPGLNVLRWTMKFPMRLSHHIMFMKPWSERSLEVSYIINVTNVRVKLT